MDRLSSARTKLIICLCLALMTGAVFGVAVTHDFINYDDPAYVTKNHHVQAGLSITGVVWAFTSTLQGHWHPVTMLSHMLDCQLFGLNPTGHHFTSILFHILNSLLLFVLLQRMTKALWPSTLVAALFALHPLHVESVVWISARKDVLSTFFMLITLWVYASYTNQPGWGRYFTALSLFALGLLSKSMMVTLPFLLLLLDFWPLGRLTGFFSDENIHESSFHVRKSQILWEKTPFFLISIIVSTVTLLARQDRLTDTTRSFYSFSERIIHAVDGYTFYIWKMFLPIDLSIPYQLDNPVFNWQSVLSLVFLAGLSILCFKEIKKRPYLVVGWLWYLGMLAPVSGIVKVGPDSLSDRYTYVPLIGLFIMLSWGVFEVCGKGAARKKLCTVVMVIILATCSVLGLTQLRYWKNGITLFSHSVLVNPDNSAAQLFLGFALYKADNKHIALEHLKRAAQLTPGNTNIQQSVGSIFSEMGQCEKAIEYLSKAVRISPNHKKSRIDLAICLAQTGDFDKAYEHFIEAIKLNPDDPDAYYKYGYTLGHQEEYRESFEEIKKTLYIDPEYTKHYDLGRSIKLYEGGELSEAEGLLKEILRRFPMDSEASLYLGLIALSRGELDSAISYLRNAIKADSKYAEAHVNLGIALAEKKEYAQADEAFFEALKIDPSHVKAHYNYAASLYLQNRDEEAVEELFKTLEIDPNFKQARDLLKSIQITD